MLSASTLAPYPKAVEFVWVTDEVSVKAPTKVLLLPVVTLVALLPALDPTNVLFVPVVCLIPAFHPNPVFSPPVEVASSAPQPNAEFPDAALFLST